jgi:hypothetical protein
MTSITKKKVNVAHEMAVANGDSRGLGGEGRVRTRGRVTQRAQRKMHREHREKGKAWKVKMAKLTS